MYKLSIHLFRVFWLIILLMSVVLFFLDIWGQDSWSRTFVPEAVAYGFLVFLFHTHLLTGQTIKLTGKNARGPAPNRHFWFAYAFPFAFFIGSFFVFLKFVEITFPTEALVGRASIAYALILSFFFFGILLSAIGTMIPAAAIGASTGFQAALIRSRKSFWFVFWRLLVGPVLYSMALLNLMVQLDKSVGLPPFPESFSAITAANTVYHVAATFLGIFNSALAASIFSMAYVWSEERQKLKPPKETHVFTGESIKR